uniref:HAT C-terminal dimerisation domain-containing protein n=1 Tax=Kalanchoe fedtschenkoi TaxID=63787 RepID=A0A7N1A1C2_KALFE
MSSILRNRVQKTLLDINYRVFYAPYGAHSLNLMLCDMTNTCGKARDFFGVIQRIYTIFEHSTKRWLILKDNMKGLTLKSMSSTRWESRVDSVRAIRFEIVDIRETLLQVAENNNGPKIKSEAKSLDIEMLVFLVQSKKLKKLINYFLYIVDQNISSLKRRFEQYEDYEKIFRFLFTSKKLNALDDVCLKSSCDDLEVALKNGDSNDVDANEFAIIAYRILLTISMTVASAERSFSKLKLLKFCLRSSMSQERLNGLALLAIENDYLEKVAYENLIENFFSKNSRRLLLFK